jgi:hypothetical protein
LSCSSLPARHYPGGSYSAATIGYTGSHTHSTVYQTVVNVREDKVTVSYQLSEVSYVINFSRSTHGNCPSARNLEETITYDREALTRYEQSGRMKDLKETIILHCEALTLRPPGHPDRSSSLNDLANAVFTRYEQSGRMKDVDWNAHSDPWMEGAFYHE